MSLLPPFPSSAVVLNHVFSVFLRPLSDCSPICRVPVQWLVILDTIVHLPFCTLWHALCRKVYLGYKKSNPCRKYAIKVMKKVDMVNKNMASQGSVRWVIGTTVFRAMWNFDPSHGICPFPQNFYVFAEFCIIRCWPMIRGQIRHILVGFRWPWIWIITICRNDYAVKCMTATRALTVQYWAELIWNIACLFGRQTVVAGDKYCIFGWILGAVED